MSVSRDLERVNREKLAGYARPEQFAYAANTIDGARVLHMAGLSKAEARAKAHGQDVSPQTGSASHGAATIDTENIASTMSTLLKHFTVREIIQEARSGTQSDGTYPGPRRRSWRSASPRRTMLGSSGRSRRSTSGTPRRG